MCKEVLPGNRVDKMDYCLRVVVPLIKQDISIYSTTLIHSCKNIAATVVFTTFGSYTLDTLAIHVHCTCTV